MAYNNVFKDFNSHILSKSTKGNINNIVNLHCCRDVTKLRMQKNNQPSTTKTSDNIALSGCKTRHIALYAKHAQFIRIPGGVLRSVRLYEDKLSREVRRWKYFCKHIFGFGKIN